MEVTNRIGKSFENLGRRILYSYIASYPKLVLVKEVSEESQKQMHAFMKEVLTTVYNNPELIGIAEVPDDCYKGYALNNSKPELIKEMEKIEAKFITFIIGLITVGKNGEYSSDGLYVSKANMTISKILKERLQILGLSVDTDKAGSLISSSKYPSLFEAWKKFAIQDDESAQKVTRTITFIHARYFGKVYTAADFFSDLLPDTRLLCELENFFSQNGFTLSNFDINNKTRFAYVKWIKEYPNKEIASFRAYFNWRKDNQMVYEFHVPGFRLFLNEYDNLSSEMQRFIFTHLKTCDGCGYCTQMDKTGKRPRLALPLKCGSESASKCPLYPWFNWGELFDEDMKNMLDLFIMTDKKNKFT